MTHCFDVEILDDYRLKSRYWWTRLVQYLLYHMSEDER